MGWRRYLGRQLGQNVLRFYASLGLRLDYDSLKQRVTATADLSRVAGWCDRGFAAQHTPSARK